MCYYLNVHFQGQRVNRQLASWRLDLVVRHCIQLQTLAATRKSWICHTSSHLSLALPQDLFLRTFHPKCLSTICSPFPDILSVILKHRKYIFYGCVVCINYGNFCTVWLLLSWYRVSHYHVAKWVSLVTLAADQAFFCISYRLA